LWISWREESWRYFAYRKHDGGGIRPESWGEALSFSTVEQMEEEGMELE